MADESVIITPEKIPPLVRALIAGTSALEPWHVVLISLPHQKKRCPVSEMMVLNVRVSMNLRENDGFSGTWLRCRGVG